MPPTTGQLALLIVATVVFALGGAVSLLRLRFPERRLQLAAKGCLLGGILAAGGVLVWHSVTRGNWVPLEDNFDAFVWLAILLAAFVAYVQRSRPLAGLDWFTVPIVVLLLAAAAVFGSARWRAYPAVDRTWSWVHRLTSYGGAVAFAVAGAVGAMYLIANRRLRRKTMLPGPRLGGSLERLEHVTLLAVTAGFGLLTIGLVTGVVEILHHDGRGRLGAHWFSSPKVLLTFVAWVVYALVLHSPINPSFRGRRAAMLSIVGFALMVGILVAVQFMPAGGGVAGGGAAGGVP